MGGWATLNVDEEYAYSIFLTQVALNPYFLRGTMINKKTQWHGDREPCALLLPLYVISYMALNELLYILILEISTVT